MTDDHDNNVIFTEKKPTFTIGWWEVKARCLAEAKKYELKAEFRRSSAPAYNSAMRNGWIDEICDINEWTKPEHSKKPTGYWQIKENCLEEAKKYNGRTHFHTGNAAAYNAAWRNGWLDELASVLGWPLYKRSRL